MEPDRRDEVVDFIARWSQKTGFPIESLLDWIEISVGKYVPVQLKFEEEAKEERSFRRRELWSETFEERTKTLERRGEDETAAPAFD